MRWLVTGIYVINFMIGILKNYSFCNRRQKCGECHFFMRGCDECLKFRYYGKPERDFRSLPTSVHIV